MQRSATTSSVLAFSLGLVIFTAAVAVPGREWRADQAQARSMAQAGPTGTAGPADAESEELLAFRADLPAAPSFLRLLRITLEPGAISVNHTHPGPEFGRLEQGELTVRVQGEATLQRVDEGEPGPAPDDEDFALEPGDRIAYPAGTAIEFRNEDDEPAVILTAVFLPAGNQRPAGISYPDGTPSADAFEGVSPLILGDAVATALPPNAAVVAIERLTIEDGAPVPGYAGPALLSLESGALEITLASGEAQVYQGATAELQLEVEEGEDLTLAPGDALFFPRGLAEAARVEGAGELVIVRLSTSAEGEDAAATPAAEAAAVIVVNTPEGGFPTPTPTPTAAAAPEATAAMGAFVEGDTVVVNPGSEAEVVNLRAEPSTEGDIVDELTLGEELVITGPPEEGGDFLWYPVEVVATGQTGFIAADFIGPA